VSRDTERQRFFSRRAFILGVGKLAIFSTLASRLIYLQVIEQEKFKMLSDKNRISMRLLLSRRGEIMDRFGIPLAINRPDFRAFITAEQTEDISLTIKKLSKFIPISENEEKDILRGIKKNRAFIPILVKENLNWKDMSKIEINIPDLPGVSIEEGEMRAYPLGSSTAHVIGYTGKVNGHESDNDPLMSIAGFRVGKTGIEKQYDKDLRGVAGRVESEVNVVGREIRELERSDSMAGKRLSLTLDSDLQILCQGYISHKKSSSAVVMDAHSGDIYALCSHPSFDPNLFATGMPADLWEELLSNPAKPLTDKVIAGQYPPASTFKMVTALAGLEAGEISQNTKFNCPGYYMLGNDKFHCWKHSGHGNINVIGAIRESCDVFFYELGKRVGIEKISTMAKLMGMGDRLGLDLPGEMPGLIPNHEWKRNRYNRKWQQGETIIAAIGQGFVLATPLQMATMTARMVNGGKAVTPHLLNSINDVPIPSNIFPDIGINKKHLRIIRKAMYEVVNDSRGTAYHSKIENPKYSMGGKTGTAQVRRITKAQRRAGIKNKDLPWKFRHHALFVGYAPVNNPKYVTAVVVEHGVGGSSTAAPIAKKIMEAVQKRDPGKSITKNKDYL